MVKKSSTRRKEKKNEANLLGKNMFNNWTQREKKREKMCNILRYIWKSEKNSISN